VLGRRRGRFAGRQEPARHGRPGPRRRDITGGKIGAGVVIEGGTTLVWGLSPQQFYDALYPLGDVRWLAVGTPIVIPAIITATWVQLANGFVAVTGTLANAGTTQAGGWDTTDNGAIVTWTGTTAGPP
jgi:hypothetical protein